ncbi:MAG: aminoacyl-tRNA hydrolase [Chloroflexi bacterium]|nr:aminoacyl-tRNA hydrolase [Chloroflexota bacterium]
MDLIWPRLRGLLGPRRLPTEPPARIIVGLGNPGPEYAATRHNIGFHCVDRIAAEHGIRLTRRHRSALLGEGEIEGRRIVLARPRTFVNRSGQAVTYLLARYRLSPSELLVVYDDMELPSGKIRLRARGSAGGHNGIKSIVQAVGSQDFPRLRIGIGRPPADSDSVEYVLGTPADEERAAADDAIKLAVAAVASVVTEGLDVAMNRFN